MKTMVRVFCLTLVAIMLCVTLIACGDVQSGEYFFGDISLNQNYEYYKFDGSKVTHKTFVSNVPVENETLTGTYEVEDGKITFTWGEEGAQFIETHDFAYNEETGEITIGISVYKPMR